MNSEEPNIPSKIYILFDNPSIGLIFQDPTHHNSNPIERCDQECFIHGHTIIRRQFPICLAWAISIHKAQGTTTEKIFVMLGHKFLNME